MSLIIPVFLPHEGCPHRCVFCDQHQISGTRAMPLSAAGIGEIIHSWLAQSRPENRREVQVAFYGGNFTGLSAARQEELLAPVQPFMDRGQVHSIRLSTRPDALSEEGIKLLLRYRVRVLELGVQSCDDRVLRLCGRGYDSRAIDAAARLVKANGLRLGLQLMLGLPGDGFPGLRRTMSSCLALRPDCIRIYPLLVLRGSGLEAMYRQGSYRPLSLGQAVLLAAWMKKRFDDEGIQVVRMGLQATPSLEQALVAGPWHPAFGHLVDSRLMLGRVRRALAGLGENPAGLVISSRDLSIFRGIGGANLRRLARLGLLSRFSLRADPAQPQQTRKACSASMI